MRRAVTEADLDDFDEAYAHEATGAGARLPRPASTRRTVELAAARAVPIADDEDRAIVEADLAAGPWYGVVDPLSSEV